MWNLVFDFERHEEYLFIRISLFFFHLLNNFTSHEVVKGLTAYFLMFFNLVRSTNEFDSPQQLSLVEIAVLTLLCKFAVLFCERLLKAQLQVDERKGEILAGSLKPEAHQNELPCTFFGNTGRCK